MYTCDMYFLEVNKSDFDEGIRLNKNINKWGYIQLKHCAYKRNYQEMKRQYMNQKCHLP